MAVAGKTSEFTENSNSLEKVETNGWGDTMGKIQYWHPEGIIIIVFLILMRTGNFYHTSCCIQLIKIYVLFKEIFTI